jgi:ubiquitin carboxyl-terminal hydrolase L3
MGEGKYRKHFIPLESNPEVFTKLSHKLGITETLSFVEVLELKEVERPPYRALALVLVFPTSEEYEQRRSAEDVGRQDDNETNKDGLIWLPQTINNACGLYAILHAACNGVAKLSIRMYIPADRVKV